MAWATTVSGSPSITSSPKARSAFPTLSSWRCTSPTKRGTPRSAAASISLRCGTRCGWRRISPWPTFSPATASFLASVAATTRARWKRSVLRCAIRRPTELCSRSRSRSSSSPSTTSASRIRATVPYRGYTLEELTLVPRPFNLPVECWQPIQGGSARALEFMARHGIQGMVGGGSAEGGAMHRVVLDWQAAHAKLGKPIELGERLCFGFHFYMADSREQGMKEAAKYYEENMKMFGELRLVRAITEEQVNVMRDPKRAPTAKLPRIEDAVKAGGFLCGNADDLIEHIKALEKRYPALDRISVSLSVGVPEKIALEQLDRFGKEVIPAFKGAEARMGPLPTSDQRIPR